MQKFDERGKSNQSNTICISWLVRSARNILFLIEMTNCQYTENFTFKRPNTIFTNPPIKNGTQNGNYTSI